MGTAAGEFGTGMGGALPYPYACGFLAGLRISHSDDMADPAGVLYTHPGMGMVRAMFTAIVKNAVLVLDELPLMRIELTPNNLLLVKEYIYHDDCFINYVYSIPGIFNP